jgi:hypothetical protein
LSLQALQIFSGVTGRSIFMDNNALALAQHQYLLPREFESVAATFESLFIVADFVPSKGEFVSIMTVFDMN